MIDIVAFEKYFRILKRKKLAASTCRSYIATAMYINDRLLPGEEISQEFYEDFVDSILQKHDSESAANKYINTFNHWIDYLNYKDIPHKLKKLACRGVAISPVTVDKILSPNELSAIYSQRLYFSSNREIDEHLNLVYSTLIMFISQTGCRNDEARQLLISGVNLERGEVWFFHNGVNHTKGKRSRVAFIESPELLERIRRLIGTRKDTELVFTSSRGGKIQESHLSQNLKRAAAQAGIKKKVWPHLLRHSYSADLTENDVPIEHLSELLGHADIRTTQLQYGHYNTKKLRNSNRMQTNVKKALNPELVVEQDMEMIKKLRIFNDDRFPESSKILAKLRVEMLDAIKM